MTDAPDPGRRARRAASFGAGADAYDRTRPDYPAELVDWLLASAPARAVVVDLGAGTGKLTRMLLDGDDGHREVIAVDPAAGMLDVLRAEQPSVDARLGSAEALPLPDASADAICCAQAWHWVDPARAVPEAARVLRPGGVLGLIWNVLDEREPWVAELVGVVGAAGHDVDALGALPAPFRTDGRREAALVQELDADALPEFAASRSSYLTASASEQRRMRDAAAALAESVADAGGRIRIPYRSVALRFVREEGDGGRG